MKRIILSMVGALAVALLHGGTAAGEVCAPAWTETVEHPAVIEVVEHPAQTETVPGVWANWSPNDTQGPQDYVPIWPVDERGTWHVHDQGVPEGHEGPDGVYQQGQGNSPWFYRQAEQVIEVTPAYTEEVVVEEAWTEVIEHPAEECEEPPVTDPPVNEPPVVEPPVKPEPKPEDPVIDKHTTNTPTKTVTVTTHESGRVTREVKRTPNIHALSQEGM